jgi:predicted O-methyltransferase YrrM
MGWFTKLGFDLASRTRLQKYLYYRYDYSFSPHQLGYLVGALDCTASLPGVILEVGCAYGHTTVFLNKHLAAVGDRRRYICIDTFHGFTMADTNFEERERGKDGPDLRRRYADVTLRTFERTMKYNDITWVEAVKADVATWEPHLPEGVSFCLIDVDLYLPVTAALQKIVPLMQPGAVTIIDDCQAHPLWDGALQAYTEFTATHGIPARIVEGQFGLIEQS